LARRRRRGWEFQVGKADAPRSDELACQVLLYIQFQVVDVDPLLIEAELD
jgi:hypothetical protein